MNKKPNYILYAVILLTVSFYAFLTGCKGSSSTNPTAVYYYNGSSTPQDINVNITNDGKVVRTSAPSGKLVIEAPEANTFDSDVILKITESPSVGNESSLLTVGSTIYGITATKDGVPVNMLSHPLNITFSNEEKLNGASGYYIGIKDIDRGDWQFINVYSANPSMRTAFTSSNQFSYSIYKNNILVTLFADLRNLLQNTPKVSGVIATLTPAVISTNNSKYSEDLKVNLLLSGENLSGLVSEDYKLKIVYFSSDSRSTVLKVDNETISESSKNTQTIGTDCAHYFQFVPLSINYSAGFAPSISFDLNLKDMALSEFPTNFIVEISNNDTKSLSFAYSSLLAFARSSSGTAENTDTSTNTDTETGTDTGTNTGTDTDTEPKAVVSLKSPAEDFPVANSKVELEFSEDIAWNDESKARITIDNNAVINDYSYSNKVLSLTFKDRLAYNTTYVLNITDMAGVENTALVFKTADAGTVSLKSDAVDFQVSNSNIELEFSTDIPWSMANKDKISIDNNAEITDFTYSNKILTLSLRKKLKFASLYLIKIDGLDGIENNTLVLRTEGNAEASLKSASEDAAINAPIEVEFSKDIYFENDDISNISLNNGAEIAGCSYANKVLTLRVKDKLNYDTLYTLTFNNVNGVAASKTFNIKTQKINARPVISLAEDSIMPNMNGRTSLQPKFFINFGKAIASSALALKNIKLNNSDLPEGCTLEFDADMQNAVLGFANNLDEAKDCILSINAYTDEDKGNINAVEFTFKTMPSENLPGSGTIDNPFLVYHQGHLSQLNNTTPINYLQGNYFFKQMDDINLTGDWSPIGNAYTRFNGKYDGNSKVISNIKCSSEIECFGLFGYIYSGSVSNLTIRNADIVGGRYYLSAFSGKIENSNVENLKIEGNVNLSSHSGDGYEIGALAGWATNNTFRNISINAVLNIKDVDGYHGGLIGWSNNNEIINCCVDSPEGLIKGNYNVGGLLGYSSKCKISNTYAHIKIWSNDGSVGGIAGYFSDSSISNCYSDCQITIVDNDNGYGGLIGNMYSSKVENSYASGSITLDCTKVRYCGTLTGYIDDEDTVENSFSSVIISVGESYTYDGDSRTYNPNAVGTSLWCRYDSSLSFVASAEQRHSM